MFEQPAQQIAHAAMNGSVATVRPITPHAEAEPLDLMSLAGSSVYKRAIPPLAALAVIIAVIIFLRRR